MKKAKVLIDTEDGQEYRNFNFVISDVNGIYIIDSESMCICLSGTDYFLEFNSELYDEVKKNIAVRNLINKN